MPELTSIQFDAAAFSFSMFDSPGELIMRSDPANCPLLIDLPKLTQLYENNDDNWSISGAFTYSRIITIDSHSQHVL